MGKGGQPVLENPRYKRGENWKRPGPHPIRKGGKIAMGEGRVREFQKVDGRGKNPKGIKDDLLNLRGRSLEPRQIVF